jgi:three-Cys-motif partner protein
MPHRFFAAPRDHSMVKAQVISKYFPVWATIVSKALRPNGVLVYLDLFSGPGRFGAVGAGGAESTPLLVTRRIVADSHLRKIVRLVFNDKRRSHADRLRQELSAIHGIRDLAYTPSIFCNEVGDALAATFAAVRMNPTFSFVDPFGYKGLTQELVRALIKDFGSECVFFFNDSAIRRALSNPRVAQPIAALFGDARARALRTLITSLPARERSGAVIRELEAALKDAGARFVLPFLLTAAGPRRTHFHVVFVTKHTKGYELMKEVMRSLGHLRFLAAGHWEICFEDPSNPWLFGDEAQNELATILPGLFQGQTVSVQEIYRSHQAGTPFVLSDYKAALRVLSAQGQVDVKVSRGKKWRPGTFPDHLEVTFPPAGG